MMKCFLLIISGLIIISTANGAEDIRVGAAVADSDIYVGQPFQYQVIIEGHRQSADVDISPLQPWSPKKAGERDFSSERITIFNGRQRRIVEKKYVMAYSLTADQPGEITLPSVLVTIEGKDYTTNPVRINILQPGQTDSIQLEMLVSQTTCFVGQPVTLTIHWYLDRDIGEYNLNIPVLNMPDTFTVEDVLPVQKAGSKIVEIMIDSQKTVASMHAATYQNQNYTAITFQKIIIAKQAGTHILDAPRVSCDLEIGGNNRRRNSFDLFFQDRRQYRRFQAIGQPIILEVRELPNEGKPEGFSGLVGQYSIETQASPTQVNVGDPITFTITIKGDLLKSVNMPDLKAIDEFAENFKIPKEQSSPKIKNNAKQFTQTIRAGNDQIKQIPPIALNYFDVDQARYVTVQSQPIPLQVTPTNIVTADQAVGNNMTIHQSEIEAVKHGIAANYEGPDIFKDTSFTLLATLRQPVYLTLWLVPLLIFLGAWVIRVLTAEDPLRQNEKRRVQALKKAQSKLKQLASRKKSSVKDTAQEIGEILRTFISDLYDKKSESLTPQDCHQLLENNHPLNDETMRFCRLLEDCDNSRYGGDAAQLDSLDYHSISDLLKTLYHGELH